MILRHSKYPTSQAFYEGLKREENQAFQELITILTASVKKMGRAWNLNSDDVQDIISMTIMKFIDLMRSEVYQFQGSCPSHYIICMARLRLLDYCRTYRKPTVGLENLLNVASETYNHEVELIQSDLGAFLWREIEQLSEKEKFLVKTFAMGYSIHEIINMPNSPYQELIPNTLTQKRIRIFGKLRSILKDRIT